MVRVVLRRVNRELALARAPRMAGRLPKTREPRGSCVANEELVMRGDGAVYGGAESASYEGWA